ncbi:MAG: hypothetical protein D4R93_02435 [Deltaproteobacteria bacterium]|nr:MAG: hypothetical protein D4R93_02435 [Deltaproteobacteria bacterium]
MTRRGRNEKIEKAVIPAPDRNIRGQASSGIQSYCHFFSPPLTKGATGDLFHDAKSPCIPLYERGK